MYAGRNVVVAPSNHSPSVDDFASWTWRRFALVYLVFGALAYFAAWGAGGFSPHYVPDSPSYLDYPLDSFDSAFRSVRTPGYPIALELFEVTIGIHWVPIAQILLHVLACSLLARELSDWRITFRASLVVGFTVLLGCTFTDNYRTIATDLPALSFAMLAICGSLRQLRRPTGRLGWILFVLFAAIAVSMRPAYLFLVAWPVVMSVLISRQLRWSFRSGLWQGFKLGSGLGLCIVAWMGARWWTVGDFGVAPFGHQNLSGVLVQLLTKEELQALRGGPADLVEAVTQKRKELRQIGKEFETGPAIATMTLDAQWHDAMYQWIVPAANSIHESDSIAQHHALADLDRAILTTFPQRYFLWLAKAFRQATWTVAADLLMHPLFLLAIVCITVDQLWFLCSGVSLFDWWFARPESSSNAQVTTPSASPLAMLSALALSFLLCKVCFVILTSPPIGRFVDAAAVFLPGWLFLAYFSRRDSELQ